MKFFFFISPLLAVLFFLATQWQKVSPRLLPNEASTKLASLPTEQQASTEDLFPFVVKKDQSLYEILRQQNIPAPEIFALVEASKPVFNLSRLNPKQRIAIFSEQSAESPAAPSSLHGLHVLISPTQVLKVERNGERWQAEMHQEEIEIRVRDFQGLVISTLWESATESGMDSQLIVALSEIFAWQIDFNRELRPNDRWRIQVEQQFVRGEPIGWGDILSAEYINEGESYQAILFRKDGENIGYFSPDGESLRKMFLKSPIKFGRITSGFNRQRFHPILKIHRPHLGVDYGARRGTPVMAVGDGKIQFAGWKGGGGNTIHIRHNAVYKTAYLHLHNFAKGIRNGARVKQGQIIGYVGSTGLSTGPHLHYEFYKHGRYVDPLKQKFPSADPVAEHLKPSFLQQAQQRIAALPQWNEVALSARSEDLDRASQLQN